MKSRKVERKEKRREKKEKRKLFNLNKSKQFCRREANDQQLEENIVNDKKSIPRNKIKIQKKATKKKEKVIESKPKLSFRQQRELEKEDKEIKRLEKLLKLNRRKKKGKRVTTLPKSFETEGLAYILDVIGSHDKQSDHNEQLDNLEQLDQDDTSLALPNEDSDESIVDSDIDEEMSDGSDEDMDEEEGNIAENDDDDGPSDSEHSSDEEPDPTDKNELKQDIYGFLRDSSGNIVKPEMETQNKSKHVEESGFNEQILRRIRGLLNRLTVNNITGISGQIQQLYEENSRNAVNQALFKCIATSVIDLDYVTQPKMKTELTLLVAILHHNVGEEVGAHIIHNSITKFDELVKEFQTSDSKIMDNLVSFLINLYVCGVTEAQLIYELMDKFCENFTEKSIELINLVLRSVGFVLRKDNPMKMKELIVRIQSEAKCIDKSSLSGARIGFLLDSLVAIKNNNMTKLKGYGSEVDVELIGNTLKNAVNSKRVKSIPGTYEAIVQSSHWYSYTQNIEAISLNRNNAKETATQLTSEKKANEELIKRLRLNTPLRKAIVIALSSCDDYIDASNRLISIGQKQFSEVINVLLHICIHEKGFNPFYSHLFNHLSKCDRKYKLALDFGIRDKITELESLKADERNVLAKLVLELLKLNTLSITCLKVVQFSDMNEVYVHFIKSILTSVLEEEELIERILFKISKKDSFATAIRLFINCFIDPKYKNKLKVKTN